MTFDFNNIKLQSVIYFANALEASILQDIDNVKKKYSRNCLHFDDIVEFCKSINLLKIENHEFKMASKFENLSSTSTNYESELRNLILSEIFSKHCKFTDKIQKYIVPFEFKSPNIILRPTASFNVKHSGLRNLLIELELMKLDEQNATYVIENNNLIYIEKLLSKKSISAKHLKHILSKKEEIGLKAEIEIIKFERESLRNHSDLASKIEHTAILNASAGYDIKSFTFIDSGKALEKYIEVKAVSISDYRFYLSKNELEKSKILSKNYFIYLLPVMSKDNFDTNNLLIVQNPYASIYNDRNNWKMQIENYSFEKT